MEDLFYLIMQRLGTMVPGLKMIDVDWGQLDSTSEEGYPVTFPCCLIDVPDIPWTQSGTPIQPGEATIVIKVGINPLGDTHYTSGQWQKSLTKLRITKDVHKTVNLYTTESFSKLILRRTRAYNIPGGIKIVEFEYGTNILTSTYLLGDNDIFKGDAGELTGDMATY